MKTQRTVAKLFAPTLAMVVLLTCTPLYAQTKPKFTYQSLGTLGGTKSTAEGINDLGEVVGIADLSNGSSVPYLYTPAAGMKNLNVLTEGPMDYPERTLFGPDGRFYVCNGGTAAGRGSVAVFNPLTGDLIEMFIPVGSGGLENPADMTFGPDGDLYIPSFNGPGTSRNRILRFEGPLSKNPGAYLGEFVAYGYGGVNSITYLTFGPDVGGGPTGQPDGHSDLFVSCALTNDVLVFSGVDGTFIDVFVEPGAGGLESPGTLIFDSGELLVASRLTRQVLRYDGLTGEFLGVFASFPSSLELTSIGDMQLGPDGDLYVTARSDSQTINGDDSGAQVLRIDGETGDFIEVFIPPHAGGWTSAAPRVTFDGTGDLYVNNGNTNQILRFQGPLSSDPGAFSEIFVQGVGFILLTARDINSSGQIVGVGYPLGRRNITGSRKAAYRYTPPAAGELVGRVDDLWVPGLNYQEDATAINNNGDVAGHFVSAATNRYHAFLWKAETGFVDLGTLAGQDTYVTSINDRSGTSIQIAGYAKTSAGDRAWRYDTATGTMQNLGLISGTSGISRGWDLNNLGQVVGVANAGSNLRAFRFGVSGGMTDLGAIGTGKKSEAFGMNDSGEIVGFTDTDSRGKQNMPQAFLYTFAHGLFALEPQITNLPTSMKLKIDPWRINNGGQIIGPGSMGRPNVAYILKPQ